MMPQWTKEQQRAIDLEGQNILVSAGAGSGKTAVLTERVLRKLKEGVELDQLLILTFTKAAAKEMRDRIRGAITENGSLKDQLAKVDTAFITTFDSYALSLVQKYHYLLGVSRNLKIADDGIIKIAEQKILTDLFESRYDKEDALFQELIATFFVRGDDALQENILAMYKKLDLRYDKRSYLENYMKNYFTDEVIESRLKDYLAYLKDQVAELHYQVELLSYEVDGDFYAQVEDMLTPLWNAQSYSDIKRAIDVSLPHLKNATPEAKNRRKTVKDTQDKIKELLRYQDEEEIKSILLSTKNTTQVIVDLLLDFDTLFTNYKEANELYTFTDISKLAIKLVLENKNVAQEISEGFNEILVDEYQDTSDLQELFISAIAKNNVYMVGDIKQSIYRFRNANPLIFKEKYEHFAKGENGVKIDLNKNFRSRQEVLEDINQIFDRVMDSRIGGANYRESHRLLFGNNDYVNEGKVDVSCNLEIRNYNRLDYKEFTSEEKEAFLIAQDIKDKVENGYLVVNRKPFYVRPVRYDDFAILIDRSKSFDLFKKVFTYFKIPISIEKEENMANDDDLGLIKNILRLILKTKEKNYDSNFQFAFMAVGRSYLFRYLDEELFEALKEEDYFRLPMMDIVSNLSQKLEIFTARQLLKAIFEDFDFYEKMISIGNIESRLNRMEYLLNLASSLEEQGYTVYNMIDYFEDIVDLSLDIKYKINEAKGNSCRIMTIHASKGLEFPICYYAGLASRFNISDIKDKFLYHERFGIITPYFKEGIGETITKLLFKEDFYEQEISERMRLLYVALTRAREKMILFTSINPEKIPLLLPKDQVEFSERIKYKSFENLLKSIYQNLEPYIVNVDLSKANLTKDYNISSKIPFSELITESEEDLVSKERVYEKEEVVNKRYSKETKHLFTKEEKENMTFGKKFHEILENIDLQNVDESLLPEFYLKKIQVLTSLPMVKDAKEIYQEYEFYDLDEHRHGIIDLLLVHENENYIVDYKLKNIEDDAYIAQLEGYKKYIEKRTNKKTTTYLFSIMEGTLKEVSTN